MWRTAAAKPDGAVKHSVAFFIAGPPQDENGPLGGAPGQGQRTLRSKGSVGGIFNPVRKLTRL